MISGLLHDIILISFSPFILPYISVRYKDKIKKGTVPRFALTHIVSDIIVHSSSIGETKNALLFSEHIRKIFPQKKIINTVFTQTAMKTFPETVSMIIPLFTVQSLLINTKNLIFFESDIWPSYILSAKKNKSKVLLVSGKISQKTAEYWKKIPILTEAKKLIDHVFAKDEENLARFKYAGFPSVSLSVDLKNLIFLRDRKKMKIKTNKKILLGLSTRGGEEIKFLLQSYVPNKIGLIIAPRHNFEEAEKIISEYTEYTKLTEIMQKSQNKKIETIKKQIEDSINTNKVILVDTYGMTEEILKISDLCFLGGTISNIGGHNALEPISFGIPVLAGHNNWNVPKELINEGIVKEVKSPEELKNCVFKSENMEEKIYGFIKQKSSKVKDELEKIVSYIV